MPILILNHMWPFPKKNVRIPLRDGDLKIFRASFLERLQSTGNISKYKYVLDNPKDIPKKFRFSFEAGFDNMHHYRTYDDGDRIVSKQYFPVDAHFNQPLELLKQRNAWLKKLDKL